MFSLFGYTQEKSLSSMTFLKLGFQYGDAFAASCGILLNRNIFLKVLR